MPKKGDDGLWTLLIVVGGVVAGTILLSWVQSGQGKENDSTLVPNSIEDQLDLIVEKLNDRFGHRWVDLGLDALRAYLRGALPGVAVALVDVVYAVELEQASTGGFLTVPGYVKKQAAVRRAKTLA